MNQLFQGYSQPGPSDRIGYDRPDATANDYQNAFYDGSAGQPFTQAVWAASAAATQVL